MTFTTSIISRKANNAKHLMALHQSHSARYIYDEPYPKTGDSTVSHNEVFLGTPVTSQSICERTFMRTFVGLCKCAIYNQREYKFSMQIGPTLKNCSYTLKQQLNEVFA